MTNDNDADHRASEALASIEESNALVYAAHQVYEALQPPIGWDLIEGGEEEGLHEDETDAAFEEFELEAEDLETDWEEID